MIAVIASERFKDGYVSKKVEKWDQDIEHNEPHRLSNQKNFVYLAEIGD